MAKLINLPGTRPANEGETLVVSYLVDHLPGTYTIIPNVEIIQRGRSPFEYDIIVIAPHAIYVVEIKRWLGGIQGDDFTWLVDGIHNRPNPWITANNKSRVLKSALESRMPGFKSTWTEAVIAIADSDGQINLRGNCRERVFRYTDLPAFLMDAAALEGKNGDLRPQRANLENAV
ncbi:MAG: nuclease-related domain-containing protein, partial [Chloroflexi bacterium]|nr:nuclease-related domain-containing protein [Chloroflexota bacterium]